MSGERRTFYDGKIHMCPNCGAPLESFTTKCSACGMEVRGMEATASVAELESRLEWVESKRGVIDDETLLERKILIIENFSIPNTKEDIFEFIILAASQIDITKKNASEDKLMSAWRKKFEQAYYKARVSFGDSVEFEKAERIYNDELVIPKRKKILKIVLPILISILFVVCISVVSIISTKKYEEEQARSESILDLTTAKLTLGNADVVGKNYQDMVELFQGLGFTNIETRELQNARKENGEVDSVSIDGKTQFKKGERFEFDSKIIINYRVVTSVQINVGYDSLIGKNYQEVIDIFETLGLANIEVKEKREAITDSGKTEGETEMVSVNGRTDFVVGDIFDSNAKIVITYRVMTTIEMTVLSKDLKGMDYLDVRSLLRDMGFTNIVCKENEIWGNITHAEGTIKSISINGESSFSVGDRFEPNTVIIITYYK